jgi:hypothetical protein
MLTAFAESTHASRPASATSERWSRAAVSLAQELRLLRSFEASSQAAASSPQHQAALKDIAVRLTQLARTQDGLRFEQSIAAPAGQLTDQRRLVVFAAWQLIQALEQSSVASR